MNEEAGSVETAADDEEGEEEAAVLIEAVAPKDEGEVAEKELVELAVVAAVEVAGAGREEVGEAAPLLMLLPATGGGQVRE